MIGHCIEAYAITKRGVWVKQWPGQSVLCVSQKYWTSLIQESIVKGQQALEEYLNLNNEQIEEIVKIVRGKLSKQNRTTLQALIVLDVHARDVLANLIDKKVSSVTDFEWLCQMRYYWEVCLPCPVVHLFHFHAILVFVSTVACNSYTVIHVFVLVLLALRNY